MAKSNKSRGYYIDGPMHDSKAFHSLRGSTYLVLSGFLSKRHFEKQGKKKYCINCDNLTFTYKEAKNRYGISCPSFSNAINQLLAKGFIVIIHAGGSCDKDKTIYGMSNKYLIWEPGDIFEVKLKVVIQKGFLNNPKTIDKSILTRGEK